MGINRKNIYRVSKRESLDLALKGEIETTWKTHPSYGHLKLGWHLKVNHKRVSRVMRKYHLKPPRRKVHRFCTRSTPHQLYFNLIQDWVPTKPHDLWCSDVSYLKFKGQFWYIATIIDIVTRQVLAVQISKHHNHQLILSTINQAMIKTKTLPLIFHTDQGTEYMAGEVIDFLETKGVNISVSDKASPWQNGYQESFFGRFKAEFGDFNRFDTIPELIEAIYIYVRYYNQDRIHKSLKMPPAVYALQFS